MSEEKLTGDAWVNKRQGEIIDEIRGLQKEITKTIEPKEHAAIVRKALKVKFPDIKFSVRTDIFAGGAAVDIYSKNHDGFYHPRKKEIEEFVNRFDGFRSDLMDGRYNVGFEWEGERLCGASFCSYQGNIS